METAIAASLRNDLAARERRIIRQSFLPRTRMTVLEWADERRYLSPEANAMAATAGGPVRYDSSVTPYHREPMLALSDPRCEVVVCMFPSQDGKTEILNNFIGSRIDIAPAPILVLQPTGGMAETWSKDRLTPMLRDTPTLRGKVKDSRSRDSGNTILHKQFPGGQLTVAGSNSAAELSARPIQDVCVDEVDRCARSAGDEGDSIRLAFRRATTFRRGKKLLISSPTLKGESRIFAEYELGTQERWEVRCPHCHQLQFLRWGGKEDRWGLRWDDSTSAPYYLCEHNACVIEESWKPWMNSNALWVAQNPKAGPRVRSFWKNALTATLASWRKMRDEWLAVQHKPLELQTFVNTVQTELWDPQGGNALDADTLFARLETYPAEVPAGVGLLVRTTDVQDDRLETAVWGFGDGEEMWLIDFDLIPGNPSVPKGGVDSPWDEHDALLEKAYRHEGGVMLRPLTTFIDSGGHATGEVYTYTRLRQHRRVYAIKGHNVSGAPILGKPTRNNNQRAILYMVGVSAAKTTIQRRLAQVKQPGKGYIHLPAAVWMDRARVEQFTNEKFVPRVVDGYVRHVWVKTGPNELFDLAAYALGALQHQGPKVMQQLGAMAAHHLSKGAQQSAPPEPEPASEALTEADVPRRPAPRRTGGYVGGWR